MTSGVLVAGVGNVFLGDDGFGVEVARRLAMRSLPPEVRVADFGIRGVHLAYELLEGYDILVLVDAVPMSEPPGTVSLIEVDPGSFGAPPDHEVPELDAPVVDAHGMSPQVVLATLARLGGSLDRVVVVGCRPLCLEEGIGLSPPVAEAVEVAVRCCEQLAAELTAAPRPEDPDRYPIENGASS